MFELFELQSHGSETSITVTCCLNVGKGRGSGKEPNQNLSSGPWLHLSHVKLSAEFSGSRLPEIGVSPLEAEGPRPWIACLMLPQAVEW